MKLKHFLFLLVIPLLLSACTQKPKDEKVTLNYWGIYEPESNFEEVIREYQTQHPNITINYSRKGLTEYKQQLIARAGLENGPDIMRFHNSWLPELRPLLASVPAETLKNIDYQNTFYQVQVEDLTTLTTKEVKGIPLMYDGLGLYYNKEIFRQAGLVKPPESWKEVTETAIKLKAESQGKLVVGGLAMGSTENVDYWPDILALLMMQNNASLKAPASTEKETQTALAFYQSFISEHQVWNDSMVNSVEAFAQGRVAMIFGTSWTAFDIQAKNTNLEFAVAEVPQLPGSRVGVASYWVEGVSSKSSKAEQQAAWEFLSYLSQKEIQQRLYAIQGQNRLFGEPPSRIDLAESVQSNQYIKGIMDNAKFARSTYINDKTFGGGMNQELINQYKLLMSRREYKKAAAAIDALYVKYSLRDSKALDITQQF